jgi:hypothetical protein
MSHVGTLMAGVESTCAPAGFSSGTSTIEIFLWSGSWSSVGSSCGPQSGPERSGYDAT